jgi:DHA1 family multidrug resistance protein-like MFS transporter
MTIFMTRAGSRATLVPLRADEALGWGPAEIGLLFSLTGATTLFTLMPAAWTADHVGRRHVILFSGVLAGVGTLIVAGSAAPLGFVVGNVVMSLGTGTAGPAPGAFAADITPANMRGMGVALYRSAGDVGFLVGPFALGWLADLTSISTALVVAAWLVIGTAVAFMITQRHHPAAGRQIAGC